MKYKLKKDVLWYRAGTMFWYEDDDLWREDLHGNKTRTLDKLQNAIALHMSDPEASEWFEPVQPVESSYGIELLDTSTISISLNNCTATQYNTLFGSIKALLEYVHDTGTGEQYDLAEALLHKASLTARKAVQGGSNG